MGWSRIGLKREPRMCFHCGQLGMVRLLNPLGRLRPDLARGLRHADFAVDDDQVSAEPSDQRRGHLLGACK